MTNHDLHAAPEGAEVALSVMLAWLAVPPWPKARDHGAARLLGPTEGGATLAARLDAAGQPGWAEVVRRAGLNLGEPDPDLHWLTARAAERLGTKADHPQLFAVVDELLSLGRVDEDALADAVKAQMNGVDQDHPLLVAFGESLREIFESRHFERLRAYEATREARPLTTRDIWPGSDFFPLGYGWGHRVVAALWPKRYFDLLAQYPPAFQHAAVARLGAVGTDLAVMLIAASPLVYDGQGFIIGPPAIFALLDVVESEILEENGEPTPVEALLDAIFQRNDGPWIARAWLQQIVWRGAPRRAGRSVEAMEVWQARIWGLVRALSRRAPPREDWLDWVRAEEPLWRVNRVLVEAAIEAFHDDPPAGANVLATAVVEGVVSATGRPAGMATASIEAHIVGLVLGNIPAPEAWFEALWRATYSLREHLSFSAHRDLDNPAYPALAWGLRALNTGTHQPKDLASFWRRLQSAVAETQQIDPNAQLPDGVLSVICLNTAQLGAVFVERGELPLDDLARFLAGQLEPTEEHVRLWSMVRAMVPESTALRLARSVGPPVRQALEYAFNSTKKPGHNTRLNDAERDQLEAFVALL